MRNIYNTTGNSKTVTLQAGNAYPILIYYNQGGGGYNIGLGFSFNGGSLITDFTSITGTTPFTHITCFKEDSKILTDKGYILVQNLKKGDLIKTLENGFVPIYKMGVKEIYNPSVKDRIKDQLYVCSPKNYPEVFEDLVITGCHSILVDDFKESEREKTNETLGDIYVTDQKYRLPACVDKRAEIYPIEGSVMIYHIALENDDYYMNYGIYANGLLVETCSKRYLEEISEMTIL
jgi:hypothetical protein